jgi:hypothetical protein
MCDLNLYGDVTLTVQFVGVVVGAVRPAITPIVAVNP